MALFILPSDSRNVAPTSTLDSLQAASVPPPQRDISIASSAKTNEFLINPSSGTPFPSIPLLPLLSGSSSSSSERPFQFAPSTPVFVLSTTPLLGTIATTRSSLRTTPTSTVPLNSNNPQNPISSASPSSFRTEARSMKEQATIAPVPIMSMLDNTDPFADPTSFSLLPSSMKARPTRTPSDNNDAGQNDGVNPFTKTVFIVFGVLGAIAIITAMTVIVLVLIRKKRLLTLTPTPGRDRPSRRSKLNFMAKKPSADSMEANPPWLQAPLTFPEQAIVNRATSQKNRLTLNLSNNTSLGDAINSFVSKSRSVSYKIGP